MSTVELETVGEDYYLFLGDLTTNSRPIISNLTQLAQENVNAAQYITKAIVKRIEKAPPNQKLFAFYLLDSICKNTGSPYTLLFGHDLFQTFTQAFLLVDETTRKKFIALFQTWKTATTSSGLPLFPSAPIEKIEQFLIKAGAIYQNLQQSNSRNTTPTPIPSQIPTPINGNNPNFLNNASLIPYVDKVLYLTNQRLLANPQDAATITQKLQVINSLKFALQSQPLAQEILQQINYQLSELTRQELGLLKSLEPKSPPPPPVQTQPQPVVPNLQTFLNKTEQKPVDEISNPIISNSNNNNGNTVLNTGLLNNLLNLKPITPTLPTSTKPKTDLSDLFAKLQQKGLVNKSLASSAAGSTTVPSTSALNALLSYKPTNSASNANFLSSILQKSKPAEDSKTIALLATFKITSKFLSNDPLEQYKYFFETTLPDKCGTCGKRFKNTPRGLELRREHLDWHFRINKRLKAGAVVQSRAWYLDDEQFVNFRDDEIFSNVKETEHEDLKETIDEKKKKNYVIVPPDSTDMRIVCGICKESMNGEYDEDLGEWVFQNAIEANGKIFHDICFSEANKTGTLDKVILKRDRNDEKKIDLNLLKVIGNITKTET